MDPRERLEALAGDRQHGASEIAEQALEALEQLARRADDPLDALADAGAQLVHAHPAMAPLIHLANDVLGRMRTDGLDAFERLRYDRDQRARRLTQAGAGCIDAGDTIATYSRSGTVLGALETAHEQGRRFSVVVSEARPGLEGVSVARDLAAADVPVTLTTDAGLPAAVRRADRLLVGADSICARGLVNKTGTAVLAREASRAGTEVLVLVGTDKLYPASYRARPPLTAEQSMGHELPAGVHEASPLFECEPLDPVDAIVTEEGRWSTKQAFERVGSIELDPALGPRL